MKKFFLKYQNFILLFLSFIMFASYFLGIFLNEVHGASDLDAINHTWPAIIDFAKYKTSEIYKFYYKYGENSFPLHHLIYGKLFNLSNTNQIKFISPFISLLIPLLFFKILKQRYKLNSIIILIFFSSIIFLSPYFRSSAIWGLTENTGYIFLLLSIFFYQKFLEQRNLISIFFVCLFSSLALYTRPQLIIFSLFFYLILIMLKKNKEILTCNLFYILFAIPGIFTVFYWGGFILGESGTNNFNYFINYKSIPNSFLSMLTLFLIYSLPFYIGCQKSYLKDIFNKNNFYLFLMCFILILLIYFLFDVDFQYLSFENNKIYGQGFLVDILFRLTGSDLFILPFSAIGLFLVIYFTSLSLKNSILIWVIIFIFSFRVHFFTEYFDPLLYIIFFLMFDFNKIFEKNIKDIRIQFFYFSYYLGILTGAIYF